MFKFDLLHWKATQLKIWISLMAIASLVWLAYESWRLVLHSGVMGAIDLIQRYQDIYFWFRGFRIYDVIETASYPPASYVILWPLLGWLNIPVARWIWFFLYIGAFWWLIHILRKESRAGSRLELVFISMIPLAIYSSGATIGNGQLMLLILPALLASLLLLEKDQASLRTDLSAAALFIFALVKPSVSAPFFWIVLFFPRRLRPAILVIAGYLGLSLLSAAFQEQNLPSLILAWLSNSREILSQDAAEFSHANLHIWMSWFGLGKGTAFSSLAVLALLGLWVRIYRDADPWLLLSVAGIAARLWTYHNWYDDLLILPSVIALVRIMNSRDLSPRKHNLLLLFLYAALVFMLAPGGLYLLPSPWREIYTSSQLLIWIGLLVFLVRTAHLETSKLQSTTGPNPGEDLKA